MDNGRELGAEDEIVRFVKPRHVTKKGTVHRDAFALRDQDTGVSVNWLGAFDPDNTNTEFAISEVRRLRRMEVTPKWLLAQMNVGEVVRRAAGVGCDLSVVRDPREAETIGGRHYEADPSHALIMHVPQGDSLLADEVRGKIASCATRKYPALEQ